MNYEPYELAAAPRWYWDVPRSGVINHTGSSRPQNAIDCQLGPRITTSSRSRPIYIYLAPSALCQGHEKALQCTWPKRVATAAAAFSLPFDYRVIFDFIAILANEQKKRNGGKNRNQPERPEVSKQRFGLRLVKQLGRAHRFLIEIVSENDSLLSVGVHCFGYIPTPHCLQSGLEFRSCISSRLEDRCIAFQFRVRIKAGLVFIYSMIGIGFLPVLITVSLANSAHVKYRQMAQCESMRVRRASTRLTSVDHVISRYEDGLREQASLEKLFNYFASKFSNGRLMLTPLDFARAITPGVCFSS